MQFQALRIPRILAAVIITGFAAPALPTQAETASATQLAQSQRLTEELDEIFRTASGLPFGMLRKSALDAAMQAQGFKWHDRVKDYSKTIKTKDDRRRPEYIVIPKFCAADSTGDPWVHELIFAAKAMRDRSAQKVVRQMKSATELSKLMRFRKGDGYDRASFSLRVLSGNGAPIRVQGDAISSQKYTQEITLSMAANCP